MDDCYAAKMMHKYEIIFRRKKKTSLGNCYAGKMMHLQQEVNVSARNKELGGETTRILNNLAIPILETSKENDGSAILSNSEDKGTNFEAGLSEIKETLVESNEVRT